MKNFALLLLAFIGSAVIVNSAPVPKPPPFVKLERPELDPVPHSTAPDDKNLPKGIPIPVKFHGGTPSFLLTQVIKEPSSSMKPPEFIRGSGKRGERHRQTMLREAHEEGGLRGKLDEMEFEEYDNKEKVLKASILTVPNNLNPDDMYAEKGLRHNEWYTHPQAASAIKRPEHLRLLQKAMDRINNRN